MSSNDVRVVTTPPAANFVGERLSRGCGSDLNTEASGLFCFFSFFIAFL